MTATALTGLDPTRLYTAEEVERIVAHTRDHDWETSSRLGPAVREYLAWKRVGVAPRTLDTYERRLALLCRKLPLATVETLDVGDLMLVLDHVPVRSHHTFLAAVNGFIEWAVLFDRRTAKNPVKLLPKLKRYAPPPVRLFTEAERSRILAAAERGLDPARDRVRAYLVHDAGLRRGGCLGARVRDVDPMRREIVVVEKGEKERVIPIATPEFWIAWLDHMATPYPKTDRTPGPDDYLWFPMRVAGAYRNRVRQVTRCYPDKPMGDSGWHRWWYDLLQRANVVAPGVTKGRKPHTARHTYATETLDASNDLYAVKELLGHASTRTTERYLHSGEKHKRSAVEKLARSRGQ